MLITRRWTRYGHDRVYVTHADGTKVGYLDVKTGTVEIELPEMSDDFWEAVTKFFGGEPAPEPPEILSRPLEAGQSLQEEYERRMARREARVTARFPRVGRLLLKVFDESPSTRAFKVGADGERAAVKRILSDSGDATLLLVNRLLGKGRRDGDVDVLAITPGGVHVIDVKHYRDAKVSVEASGGLLSPRREHLYVRGRESSHLIDKVEKQMSAVCDALASRDSAASVTVSAALCFVGAQLPLIGTPSIRGIKCLSPKGTAKWLRESTGPLSESERLHIYECLDEEMPRAAN